MQRVLISLFLASGCAGTCQPSANRELTKTYAAPEVSAAASPASEDQVKRALVGAGLDVDTFRHSERLREGQIYVLTFKGQRAVTAWHKARAVLPPLGYWPVLQEASGDETNVCFPVRTNKDSETVLEESRELDLDAWLKARVDEPLRSQPQEWPDGVEAQRTFTTPFDVLTGNPVDTRLLLLPTAHGWKVPAICGWGGLPDDGYPGAEVHTALMRKWNEKYGAELVALSKQIEFIVAKPPTTSADAFQLARAQYQYCPDLVDQGYPSVEHLAASLLNAPNWYFWWD